MPPIVSATKANTLLILFVVYTLGTLGATVYLISHPLVEPIQKLPEPEFTEFTDIATKKSKFFGFMLPLVERQNEQIQRDRSQLLALRDVFREEGELSKRFQSRLNRLARQYNLDAEEYTVEEKLDKLYLRIDQIPPSMVLAQAANESAWGTSRFALKANNYFGQWCFVEGCGLVPQRRGSGKNHEVASFDSVGQSVAAYFRNINTHRAYREVRQIRARLRREGKPVTGLALIQGLGSYSERGQHYINELRQMITYNKLAKHDTSINRT